jgi:hypothetical protein
MSSNGTIIFKQRIQKLFLVKDLLTRYYAMI